jgi:hypothetical protein
VDVELAIAERFRHGRHRPEVDHIQRAQAEHIGNPRVEDRIKTVRPAGKDPADQVVGNLGGGNVQNAADQTGLDQFLHGLAAGAGGVKDQAIVAARLERLADGRDARRGHAEHRQAESGPLGLEGFRLLNHARHGVRGISQDASRDRIQPGDVHHRIHERDVGAAHVGRGIAAGDGRDHELGQPDRQRPHGRRDQRSAAAAADADHPGQPPGIELGKQVTLQRPAHHGDRLCAIGGD